MIFVIIIAKNQLKYLIICKIYYSIINNLKTFKFITSTKQKLYKKFSTTYIMKYNIETSIQKKNVKNENKFDNYRFVLK